MKTTNSSCITPGKYTDRKSVTFIVQKNDNYVCDLNSQIKSN